MLNESCVEFTREEEKSIRKGLDVRTNQLQKEIEELQKELLAIQSEYDKNISQNANFISRLQERINGVDNLKYICDEMKLFQLSNMVQIHHLKPSLLPYELNVTDGKFRKVMFKQLDLGFWQFDWKKTFRINCRSPESKI